MARPDGNLYLIRKTLAVTSHERKEELLKMTFQGSFR